MPSKDRIRAEIRAQTTVARCALQVGTFLCGCCERPQDGTDFHNTYLVDGARVNVCRGCKQAHSPCAHVAALCQHKKDGE
ncbi:hypothetical protein VT84_09340 [Gemmata sp. SH-PL17]|uniref:hypothetical protein n=1 Tax=Gemmata sp. SH-PL17 TaxID=1630693 RepID=UPI00078CB867|nr:hypothetical protein [Gemmata sp. SH-PL17]AMV24587.1 hypothetical protein VT84_09340 [Gemmata sp. SH-PL17]